MFPVLLGPFSVAYHVIAMRFEFKFFVGVNERDGASQETNDKNQPWFLK